MSNFFVDQLTGFNTVVYNFSGEHEELDYNDGMIYFYSKRREDYNPFQRVDYYDNKYEQIDFVRDVEDFWELFIWSKYHKMDEFQQQAYEEFGKKYPDFFDNKYWTFSEDERVDEFDFLINPDDYEEEEQYIKDSDSPYCNYSWWDEALSDSDEDEPDYYDEDDYENDEEDMEIDGDEDSELDDDTDDDVSIGDPLASDTEDDKPIVNPLRKRTLKRSCNEDCFSVKRSAKRSCDDEYDAKRSRV